MHGTMNLNRLINQAIGSVSAAFRDLDTWSIEEKNHSTPYTARLYSELHQLSEKLGFDVRLTYEQPQNCEFLYDVCFLETTGAFRDSNGYFSSDVPLKRAVLVLECEWNTDIKVILYDFSKLLMARSELRSLVFYKSTREGFDSVIQALKAAITAYEHGTQSDRYLICGLVSQDLHFVLIDGKGNELQLSPT